MVLLREKVTYELIDSCCAEGVYYVSDDLEQEGEEEWGRHCW